MTNPPIRAILGLSMVQHVCGVKRVFNHEPDIHGVGIDIKLKTIHVGV